MTGENPCKSQGEEGLHSEEFIGNEDEHAYLSHSPPPTSLCPALPQRVSGSLSFSLSPSKLACQKRPSGNLVSVLSGAEGSFVSSLVKSISNSYSYVWIGLHDPTQVRVYPSLSRCYCCPGPLPVPCAAQE